MVRPAARSACPRGLLIRPGEPHRTGLREADATPLVVRVATES